MLEKLRQHIEQTVPLTDDEFAWASAHFTSQLHPKRTFLIQPGQPAKHLYFVIEGLLMLFYPNESGKQHIVSFAMEDWWETDFEAYYTQAPATLALQCLENTQVLCLSLSDYQKLCAEIPKMEHFFLQKSTAGHIASQRRILSFLTSQARERYEQLLKNYPSLVQRVPKTLLATYLGVSRETLSRIFP
jgi:CRP-like cAMP-binding protein